MFISWAQKSKVHRLSLNSWQSSIQVRDIHRRPGSAVRTVPQSVACYSNRNPLHLIKCKYTEWFWFYLLTLLILNPRINKFSWSLNKLQDQSSGWKRFYPIKKRVALAPGEIWLSNLPVSSLFYVFINYSFSKYNSNNKNLYNLLRFFIFKDFLKSIMCLNKEHNICSCASTWSQSLMMCGFAQSYRANRKQGMTSMRTLQNEELYMDVTYVTYNWPLRVNCGPWVKKNPRSTDIIA